MIRQIRMILLSPLTVWKSVNNAVYVYAKLMFVALDHISSNCLYILMFVALDHISSNGPRLNILVHWRQKRYRQIQNNIPRRKLRVWPQY